MTSTLLIALFIAGMLFDFHIAGRMSPWDLAALIVLAVLLPIAWVLRRREPMPERERCPCCAHLPAWLSGCDECGGSGYSE